MSDAHSLSVELPPQFGAATESIASPALLLEPDRIRENVERMVRLVGDPARLRPHAKTCKMPQTARIQIERGIRKFKCATIAEAEMLADSGAADVLLAYPPVGPQVARLFALARAYPKTRFSTVIDCAACLEPLEAAATEARTGLDVWLDLDCGMGRTGVPPGPDAADLCARLAQHGQLRFAGLHVYDGHLHQLDREERRAACQSAFEPVWKFVGELQRRAVQVPAMVAGGTPTFPFHAKDERVECSPGTCVLWDAGYAVKLPDLDFLPAAFLLTRVVSRPAPGRLCLDLGHKAVASEMAHPRVVFPQIRSARAVMHSEEHLVIETEEAERFPVGTCLFGIPWHICPTVALHAEAVAIDARGNLERWPVTARARRLSI